MIFDQERASKLIEDSDYSDMAKSIALTLAIGIIIAIAILAGIPRAQAAEIYIRHHYTRHHVPHHVYRRPHHHRTARHHRRDVAPVLDANGNGSGLVHVATAAGISVTVAASFATKIQGFIADLVARGYHPHQIHCYASGGHVRGSLHYSGQACDFDQRGWGQTAKPMYHVADLVGKWGLRDGGGFRDWGHIDTGAHLRRGSREAHREAHPPFYGATADYYSARHRARVVAR